MNRVSREEIAGLKREFRGVPFLLLLLLLAMAARCQFAGRQPREKALHYAKSQAQQSTVYVNDEYGFRFDLPPEWSGFSVIQDDWRGTWRELPEQNQSGPVIRIRHPKYTEDEPYEDIPIMIFTRKQWKSVDKEELIVSAAPFAPGEIARNSKYVFATPPRFYFDYATGWEEVLHILGNRLHTFTPTKSSRRTRTRH